MEEEVIKVAENLVEVGATVIAPAIIIGVVAVGLSTIAKGFEK